MKAFSTMTVAALLAAGAASVAAAQAQSPPAQPGDGTDRTSPSAASSPHQRQSTGNAASEASADNGTGPGDASSPSQHQAMKHSTSGDMNEAKTAGATPETFVKAAAQDGMAEVALAKVALSKSSNTEVKEFAQKMQQDHSQANEQLAAVAKTRNITVPTKLDAKHEAMVKSLSAKSGAAFDRAYAQHMAEGHAKAVALFESASKSSDPDLAAFAQKTLPTLEVHKQLADNLEASTGTRTASSHGGSQTR
jgi:putative membrane protein